MIGDHNQPAMPRHLRLLGWLGRPRVLLVIALLVTPGLVSAALRSSRPLLVPPPSICPGMTVAVFGPDVCVFNDAVRQATIQADLDRISIQQVPITSQFDNDRYAVLFQPGTYGSAEDPLVFQVGYYTEVAGLGYLPQDTVVNGVIDVFNNSCTAHTSNCNSDNNFWRSLSNLTLNVDRPSSPPVYAPGVVDPRGSSCTNTEESWSVSQGSPIRRVIVNGSVVFQDYSASDDYASGGFIADSQVTGNLDFYGNQQYLVRNSEIGGAHGCPQGLWNIVYSGVQGAPSPVLAGQCQQNTVLPTSPVTREEPFLYSDAEHGYSVFVPAVRHDSSGPSWAGGKQAGKSAPLSSFFVATPATATSTINTELARGRNLVLTPGIYDLTRPIVVRHQNTVVLGQGFATLVPERGNAAMVVTSNYGVELSGLIIDAGPVKSSVLLKVGTRAPSPRAPNDPDVIQDVFLRIGGEARTPVGAAISLLDNADNSIIDDVWAWRADHGNLVGWTTNTGQTGVAVGGNAVTAYGLAVEHYQRSEVVWSGESGTEVFFENELPYDPPGQSAWMAAPKQDGYPAFLVAAHVRVFRGYGMGSYVVFLDTAATLHDFEAFEVPDSPNVQIQGVFAVWIGGSGGDDSIINGDGGPVTSMTPGTSRPVDVARYP